MHGFFKHEFWKSRGRFLALLCSLCALLVAYFGYMGWMQAQIDWKLREQQEYATQKSSLENETQRALEKMPQELQEQRDALIESQEKQNKLFMEMIDANEAGDWRTELQKVNEQFKMRHEMEKLGMKQETNYGAKRLQVMRNEYLLRENIPPKHTDDACDGLNVLVQLSRQYMPILLPVCALLLSFSAVFAEMAGGVKLLLGQARPLWRPLLDKFFITWLESTLVLLAACVLCFGVCTLCFGVGYLRYPHIIGGQLVPTQQILLDAAWRLPLGTLLFSAAGPVVAGVSLLCKRDMA